MEENTTHHEIVCPYCGELAQRVTGELIYPKLPHLHSVIIYECTPCDARVGTHKNSGKPLGRLANKELRTLKMQTHAAFDRLWKCDHMDRTNAYIFLAKAMGIKKQFCHIGMFNEDQCRQAIDISRTKLKEFN